MVADAPKRHIKGGVVLARMAFVRERLGDAGIDRVKAALTAEDRAALGATIAPTAWYPFDVYERLDDVIARETGLGDEAFRLMGRASAQQNLSTTHKTFVRENDPHHLFRQAPAIYRIYYTTGHRTYERLGDKKAVLRTHESEIFSRSDCLTVVGWYERAVEMCGGKNPRITQTKCRARHDDVCEYVCEWD